MQKEILECADSGPTPPPHMAPKSWYVGVFDDEGTIVGDFFATEAEARSAFDRLECAA